MRYRINCIIISLLVALALIIIVINILEIRELRRSVDSRLHDTSTSLISKPTDLHVTTTQTRNAWIYPENVSRCICPWARHYSIYAKMYSIVFHYCRNNIYIMLLMCYADLDISLTVTNGMYCGHMIIHLLATVL